MCSKKLRLLVLPRGRVLAADGAGRASLLGGPWRRGRQGWSSLM